MATVIKNSSATPDIIQRLMEQEGCEEYRILHENECYTSDFVDNRLNIEVDNKNKINRTWVG